MRIVNASLISFSARVAESLHLGFFTLFNCPPTLTMVIVVEGVVVGRHLYCCCTLLQYHYFWDGSDPTMSNWQTLTVNTRSGSPVPWVGVTAKGTSDGGRAICLHPEGKTIFLLAHNTNSGCSQQIKNKDLLVSKASCFCFVSNEIWMSYINIVIKKSLKW